MIISREWADVDYSEINGLKIEKNSANNNVKLKIMLPPSDVPIAWRGNVEGRQCVIEFKYLSTDEPQYKKNIDRHINFFLGKKSRKIYKMVVDVGGFIDDGTEKGNVSIEIMADASAELKKITEDLNKDGILKKPNAKAIINMLDQESGQLAASG